MRPAPPPAPGLEMSSPSALANFQPSGQTSIRAGGGPFLKRGDEAANNAAPGVPIGDLTKQNGEPLGWLLRS
jgi:hypothetical protein